MSIGNFFTNIEHDVAAVFSKAGSAVAEIDGKLTVVEQAAGIVLGFAAVIAPELGAMGASGAAVVSAITAAEVAYTALKTNAPKLESDVASFLAELAAISDQLLKLLASVGPFITATANDAQTALAQVQAVKAQGA